MKVTFRRQFQLWAATVGHEQLLLRSPRRGPGDTRVDVLFVGVSVLCIPATIDHLSIEEAGDEPLPELVEAIIRSQPQYTRKVYRVSGIGFVGYVVAGGMAHVEDHGEDTDASALYVPLNYAGSFDGEAAGAG